MNGWHVGEHERHTFTTELANVFDNESSAENLLTRALYPRGMIPGWNYYGGAAGFWARVLHELESGVLPDGGMEALLREALQAYPGNIIFSEMATGIKTDPLRRSAPETADSTGMVSASTFADLVRNLHRSRGLTQARLAEAAGVRERTLSEIERTITRTARKDTVRRLADALGLSGSSRVEFENAALASPHENVRMPGAGKVEAMSSVSDEPGLLFRLYVPSRRLYAAEMERRLALFRDWLGSIRSRGIRQGGYQTTAGRVYEFFGDKDPEDLDLSQEFSSFSSFVTLCATNAPEAAAHLMQAGLSRTTASNFASRYGREIRRLNVDLRQEREQRILAICHGIETDLLDLEFGQGPIATQIRGIVEKFVPDPSAGTLKGMLELSQSPSGGHFTISINQQVIGAVEGNVIQNIEGTINFGPRAKELLDLIRKHGRQEAVSLETAVYELEDRDAPLANRRAAKKRLREFLRQLGQGMQEVAIDILEKYIEAKLGG